MAAMRFRRVGQDPPYICDAVYVFIVRLRLGGMGIPQSLDFKLRRHYDCDHVLDR